MFFTMTNAIFDASICCWEAMRHWDYVHPVTAIHFLFKGKKVRAWANSVNEAKRKDSSPMYTYYQM